MNAGEPGTTRRWRLTVHRAPWTPPGEIVLRRRWPTGAAAKQDAIAVLSEALVTPGWVLPDERPWLVLCLDEALTNAMLHGNEGDPRLEVDAQLAVDARRWHLAISDQGQGFRARDVPAADDATSLLLEHGRGIHLMRSWLSSLTYWRGGTTVVLSRRRSDRRRDA